MHNTTHHTPMASLSQADSVSEEVCIDGLRLASRGAVDDIRFITEYGTDLERDDDDAVSEFLTNATALKQRDSGTLFCVDKNYILGSMQQGFDTVDIPPPPGASAMVLPTKLKLPEGLIRQLRKRRGGVGAEETEEEQASLEDVRRRAIADLRREFSEQVLAGEEDEEMLEEERSVSGGIFAIEEPVTRTRDALRAFLQGCTDNEDFIEGEAWTAIAEKQVSEMDEDEVEQLARDIVRLKFFPENNPDQRFNWCYRKSALIEDWRERPETKGSLPDINRKPLSTRVLKRILDTQTFDELFVSEEEEEREWEDEDVVSSAVFLADDFLVPRYAEDNSESSGNSEEDSMDGGTLQNMAPTLDDFREFIIMFYGFSEEITQRDLGTDLPDDTLQYFVDISKNAGLLTEDQERELSPSFQLERIVDNAKIVPYRIWIKMGDVPLTYAACAPIEKVQMLFKLGFRVPGHRGVDFTQEDHNAVKIRYENKIERLRQYAADAVSLKEARKVNRQFSDDITDIFVNNAGEGCQPPPPLQFIDGLQPIDVFGLYNTAFDARKGIMVRLGLVQLMFLFDDPPIVNRETAPFLFQALRAQPFNDDYLVDTTNIISQNTGMRQLERPISESEFTEWLLDAVRRRDESPQFELDLSVDSDDGEGLSPWFSTPRFQDEDEDEDEE